MRKLYPYLDSPFTNNVNEQQERHNFLAKLDDFVNQKQYIRITLLDWQENGIKELEGELTSGSITKDGSSSVRRVCSFNCAVDGTSYDIDNIEMDFSLNKKVYIEVGIKNYTDEYTEYPILWFPQGVFYISQLNVSSSATSAVNLSLQLKDKMAGLNGEIGGTFPITTILDTMDTQSPTGEYITEKVLIYNLIVEMVNHIGGEQLQNIVVEDVPLRIPRVMRWLGDNPLWMKRETDDTGNTEWYDAKIEDPRDPAYEQFNTGDDVGYIMDDFYYTGELVAAPGDTVTNMLDTLIEYLGNYEYFYDEFGIFHFREIKNYLNTTQATVVTDIQKAEDYLIDITTGKSIYNFTDNKNLTNLTINPQYGNIKNDYWVQGLRKMANNDISYPVIYHLAIDYKPQAGNAYRDLLLYKSPIDGLTKAIFPIHVNELPEVGNFNLFYMLPDYRDGDSKLGVVYFWSEDNAYVPITPIKYYPTDHPTGYVTKDWRTEIYLRGLLARDLGTDASYYYTNLENSYGEKTPDKRFEWLVDIYNVAKHENIDVDYYYEELNAYWPQIYDLENQKFWSEYDDKSVWHSGLTAGNYFVDFIDPSTSGLGEFCINNIGRRSLNIYNEQINCLFEPTFPNIVFINIDDDSATEKQNECIDLGQPYTQVHSEIFCALGTGGYHFAAFDELKYQLFLHTNYAKTVSLIAIPAFYLEPNSRVTINDASTNTYGDYMITNITIPFGAGNTMSVAGSECNMDRLQ